MPEGDTIFRVAVRLRSTLEGERILDASSRASALNANSLSGQDVQSVEARGKHLLIHFDGGLTLHSHLGMTGSWHVYRTNESWQKPEHFAAIVLKLEEFVVVCFSPKTLELLSSAELRRHRYLNRLGPDLLSRRFDHAEAIRRFRVHNRTTIGEAVMNQTILSGIGNVYKSELLFLQQMHPQSHVAEYDDEQLEALLFKARDLMSRNLAGYPRQTRFSGEGQKKWVYGRSGKPCFQCGQPIQTTRQGDLGRTTYFCPECQKMT